MDKSLPVLIIAQLIRIELIKRAFQQSLGISFEEAPKDSKI